MASLWGVSDSTNLVCSLKSDLINTVESSFGWDWTFHFFFRKIKTWDHSKTSKLEQNVLRLTWAGRVPGESPSAADKHPHNQSPTDRNRWCRRSYDMYILTRCLLNILLWPNRQLFFGDNLNFWLFSQMKIPLPQQVNSLPCHKWCPSQMEG